jgi:hypothetical protein
MARGLASGAKRGTPRRNPTSFASLRLSLRHPRNKSSARRKFHGGAGNRAEAPVVAGVERCPANQVLGFTFHYPRAMQSPGRRDGTGIEAGNHQGEAGGVTPAGSFAGSHSSERARFRGTVTDELDEQVRNALQRPPTTIPYCPRHRRKTGC